VNSSQTVDSNLNANRTIDSIRKKRVLQGQDKGNPTSNLEFEVVEDHEVSGSFWRFCVASFASTGMLRQ